MRVEIVFSPTEAQELINCERRWYFANVLALEPKELAPTLGIGTAVHSALEVYFHNGSLDEVLGMYWRFAKADASEAFQKRFQTGLRVLEEYWYHYEAERVYWQTIATEFTFAVPLRSGTLKGRIDLLVKDLRTNELWLVDHKTASDNGGYSESAATRDLQFGAYLWAAEQLWPGQIRGLIIDTLKMKIPVEPKTVQDGTRLSLDQSVHTTVHTFVKTCERYGFNPNDYVRYLHWVHTNGRFFTRVGVTRSAEGLQQVERHLNVVADRWNSYYNNEAEHNRIEVQAGLPNASYTCDWGCDYANLCTLFEQNVATAQELISSSFNIRKEVRYGIENAVTPKNSHEWLQHLQTTTN